MGKLIVSFATRPGMGSEGGVGWAFVSQAALWAHAKGEKLFVVIDARDYSEVKEALWNMGEAGRLAQLVPVKAPWLFLRWYGNSRSRQTYLGWRFRAKAEVLRIISDNPIDVVHQVTFASASMPHVLPTGFPGIKTIWGPVAIPACPVSARGKEPSLREKFGVKTLGKLGKQNARKVDLLIAQNEQTQELLMPLMAIVEPNIVFDLKIPEDVIKDDFALVMSGLLINRKRPWLAIEALQDSRLSNYKLKIIGEGPLKSELEELAIEYGVQERVSFLGELKREDAIRIVSSSRVLVHPAAREGAGWVIGEAASVGVPSVVFEGSGADSTVRISANSGEIASSNDHHKAQQLVEAILRVLEKPLPNPTKRWSSDRLSLLLDKWWA